jgi:hypothetical protein
MLSHTFEDPGSFRIGDIVEVVVAFVVLPIHGARYVMVPQLRALTLLDNSIRLVRAYIVTRRKGLESSDTYSSPIRRQSVSNALKKGR